MRSFKHCQQIICRKIFLRLPALNPYNRSNSYSLRIPENQQKNILFPYSLKLVSLLLSRPILKYSRSGSSGPAAGMFISLSPDDSCSS